jgi:putative PIN family toxin of toxin-antitoxin system
MRIVIDTNILISASLSKKSTTHKIVNWCLDYGEVYFSESTLLELSSRITRTKFDSYNPLEVRQDFVKTIFDHKNSILCTPQEKITASIDLDDNKFLEVAVEVNADFLITGDKKHLLPLHPYRDIKILSARDFLTAISPHHRELK